MNASGYFWPGHVLVAFGPILGGALDELCRRSIWFCIPHQSNRPVEPFAHVGDMRELFATLGSGARPVDEKMREI